MGKTFFAKDAVAFSRVGVVAKMFLPPRCRFVIVVAGSVPQVLPITEAGNWEVDIPAELSPIEWPVLAIVLPKKHAELYGKMTAEQATDIVRQARGVVPPKQLH